MRKLKLNIAGAAVVSNSVKTLANKILATKLVKGQTVEDLDEATVRAATQQARDFLAGDKAAIDKLVVEISDDIFKVKNSSTVLVSSIDRDNIVLDIKEKALVLCEAIEIYNEGKSEKDQYSHDELDNITEAE